MERLIGKGLGACTGMVDEDLIENILAGSPLLETLELDLCFGFRRIDISSKSIKKLVVSGYSDPELMTDVIVFFVLGLHHVNELTIEDHSKRAYKRLMLEKYESDKDPKFRLSGSSSRCDVDRSYVGLIHEKAKENLEKMEHEQAEREARDFE